MKRTIYAETYAENESEWLYVFDFEDGRLSPARCSVPSEIRSI